MSRRKPISKIIITLDHDHDTDSLCDTDGWNVHSFGHRHSNYKNPGDLGFDDGIPDSDLQSKIDKGLAFPLIYFEHVQCHWSLQGDGLSCR